MRSPYDFGVVISASHNPYEDNGIKVFSSRGEKLSETIEPAIEFASSNRLLPTIKLPVWEACLLE